MPSSGCLHCALQSLSTLGKKSTESEIRADAKKKFWLEFYINKGINNQDTYQNLRPQAPSSKSKLNDHATGSNALGDDPRHPELRIETLHTDLQMNILESLPDTKDLKALIQTSPMFENSYRARPVQILARVLENELGGEVLGEAWFVIRAAKIKKGERWMENVEDFLKEDKETLTSNQIPYEDLLEISAFLPALHEISMAFFHGTMGKHPLHGGPIPSSSLFAKEPSANELRRIQRAILRLKAFSVIFAHKDYSNSRGRTISSAETRAKVFFGRYKHWEVEECHCVRDWFKREYDEILVGAMEELNPLFEVQQYLDGYPVNREIPDYWREMSELCLSKGFDFLAKVLRAKTNREKLILMVEANGYAIKWVSPSVCLSAALKTWVQSNGLRRQDALKHKFNGEEGGCNFMWDWVRNGGKFENEDPRQCEDWDAGQWVTMRRRFRDWGYVMWDFPRLEALGILNMY